jgi:hypothetical protein
VAQLRTGNPLRLASIASIERRIERIDSFVLNEVPGLFTKPVCAIISRLALQAKRGS